MVNIKSELKHFGICKNCKKKKAIMIVQTKAFCSNSCRNEYHNFPQPVNKLEACNVGDHLAGDSFRNYCKEVKRNNGKQRKI